ncbi:MAG TPA: hypothetical protein PKL82_00755 [Anaerolineaceae bacterium]|jgi:hypothetical protein|nr:hypothetical protein [Anaerolineaceae bacterium]HOA21001.1 hypothetical protein [Anaerolineaceae bacterium]HOG76772.1 hypothetical protein [Anaerolineaceae bacterium]
MTASTLSKQKPSWPMLMLGAGLIATVLALAALYNLVYLGEDALIRSYSQRLNAFPKDVSQQQVIFAAPGKSANLEIQAEKSIKGFWSAEALNLTISEKGPDATKAEAVLSKEKSWDDKIQHNAIFERRDPIFIPMSFVLSQDALVGETLAGKIEGKLVYPVVSAEGKQEDVTSSISLTFSVKVVSPDEIAQKVRTQAKRTLSVAGPIALLLIGIALAYFRKLRKPKGTARPGKHTEGK